MYFNLKEEKNPEKTAAVIAEELNKGKIAILPTSTIYGISCVYNNKPALERIYDIKRRKTGLPFIVLISSSIELEYLAEEKSDLADILIQKYWLSKNKKPLTLIFKKNKRIKNSFNPGTATIAVRLDPLEIIKKIIKKCGPIVSTSATVSGSAYTPENITQIPEEIIKKVDIILDLGQDLSGIASTIIDVTGQVFLPVREGQICIDEISNFLNFKKRNPAFLRNQNK